MSQALKPLQAGDHLFLVDGSSFIFRAYHALPPLTRKSDGMPVGAVSGFCNMLWKLVREDVAGEKPTHLAVIFDHSSKTFRNELYDQYKAHRPEAPEDLRPQFGLIREATRAFDIPSVEQEGFEADDLIATYARQAREAGATCLIFSSDKDLMQLVGNGVMMYDPMKEKRIGAPEVFEKFGVQPDRVIDVQALAGDSVDNVPGVPGIGIKTAALLIAEYGDLDTLLARAGEIKQPKRREALLENAEMARISRSLVTLKDDVPPLESVEAFAVRPPNPEKLIAFLKAMEFTTIIKRVADAYKFNAAGVTADANNQGVRREAEAAVPAAAGDAPTPQDLAARRKAWGAKTNFEAKAPTIIADVAMLQGWAARAIDQGFCAFRILASSIDPMQADLVGIALALDHGKACYIPLQHRSSASDDLFTGAALATGQVRVSEALEVLRPLFENPSVLKFAHDMKFAVILLQQHGVILRGLDDVMMMSYALEAGRNGQNLEDLADVHLNHALPAFTEVGGSGKNAAGIARAPVEKAAVYGAEVADTILCLARVLKPRLPAERMTTVYETLERPMIDTLKRMEMRGIAIDRQILSRLSGEFAQKMGALEAEAYDLAGENFNLGSPKQLGDILFGKMGAPGGTKTKTGAWSTSASILDDLAEQGNVLASRILEWRQFAKLTSNYTDALPGYVNPQTKRVHTSYALASTTTGRLSSVEPNLQNIPIRSESGRKIRTAFIAAPGHKLISADYSQIELRLLAHIADIPQLKKAFAEGLDIHAMTASEMFGVPVEGMPSDVRRRAKAINFGIIYGISAFGLANQLGIGREEAGSYIKKYFERFPGIRDYMEVTKKFSRDNGYVLTIFGRKCHYPRISSPNVSERANMERASINAPIQGSAADIIRRAMVRMEDELARNKLSAQMLLQVHDELVFEVPDNEVEATLPVVCKVMVDAPEPAIKLTVPLQVDARAAQNWGDAH